MKPFSAGQTETHYCIGAGCVYCLTASVGKNPETETETKPLAMDFGGQLRTAENARTYILAGNAYFTIRSKRTDKRFTYHVKYQEPTAEYPKEKWFVSVLTGADNTKDYTYLGMIQDLSFRRTSKSHISDTAPSYKAFSWTWIALLTGRLHDQLEIWHDGRCGRCGRPLTVPESVERGLGPDCAGRI